MRFLISALAAASLTVAAAGVAGAQTPTSGDDIAKVVVRYADLDLAREEGATVLARRINVAARAVCGSEPSPKSLHEYFRYRTCVNDSAEAAVHEVGAPLVIAIYERDLRPMMLARR
jgi:UrcA family protein